MSRFNFARSSAHRTPEESPGFLLWRASTLWRRAIEGVLKPLGLTHPQFVILASVGWLTKEGKNVSQVEIGRQAGLDPNTTSQILRSLHAKNLIERSRSKDERSKHPTLTSAGMQSLAKALPAVEKADAEFFSLVNLNKANAMEALQKLAGVDKEGQNA
jgi:DNA-binding MarR family transcriptional regulator